MNLEILFKIVEDQLFEYAEDYSKGTWATKVERAYEALQEIKKSIVLNNTGDHTHNWICSDTPGQFNCECGAVSFWDRVRQKKVIQGE